MTFVAIDERKHEFLAEYSAVCGAFSADIVFEIPRFLFLAVLLSSAGAVGTPEFRRGSLPGQPWWWGRAYKRKAAAGASSVNAKRTTLALPDVFNH